MMVVNGKVFANLKRRVVGLVVTLFSFATLQTAAYSPFSVQKGPAYVGWARWAWPPHPLHSRSTSTWGTMLIVPFPCYMMGVPSPVAVGPRRGVWGPLVVLLGLLGQEAHVLSMVVMQLEQGGCAVACIAGERGEQPSGASSWAVGVSWARGGPFPPCVCHCSMACCHGPLQGLVSRQLG